MNANLWLELYTGREVNQEQFERFFKPNGPSQKEYIHYCNYEPGLNYSNLYVSLDNNRRVEYVSFYKNVMHDPSRGKANTPEMSLTTSEKKYAKDIFDQCLIDQAIDEIDDIINTAVEQGASYHDFKIIRKTNAGLYYLDPSGKHKILARERVLQALNYSHVHLSILRIPSVAEAFSASFSKLPYEPLFAVLQLVDPRGYFNYQQLEKEYRFDRLKEAVTNRDFEQIDIYADSMVGSEAELPFLFDKPCETGDLELLKHLYAHASVLAFSLNRALDLSLSHGFRNCAIFLLQQRQCFYDLNDDSFYLKQRTTNAYRDNDPELLQLLLKKGFPFINKAKEFLQSLSIDNYAYYLPLNIQIDKTIVENVCKARRFDLLDLIESRADVRISKDDYALSSELLMEEYATFDMEDRFIEGTKRGFQYHSSELFFRCFEIGQKWTNLLIVQGVDINANHGKLLRMACQTRNYEFAKYLIDRGADIHASDQYYCIFEIAALGMKNNRPYTLVPIEELERICMLLLEKGADLEEAVHNQRETSMKLLLTEGSLEIQKYIVDWLSNRGRLNYPDRTNHLPVSYVVGEYARGVDILQYFIQHRSVLNAAEITNDKLLYSTINHKHYDMAALMIEHGANIYEKSAYSGSCMDLLIEKDNAELCKLLVLHGYDISTKNDHGLNPLEYAIKRCAVNCIEYLKSVYQSKELQQS